MNSECHYLVVTSEAKCIDRHYILPQMSLPSSDIHFHFFTEYNYIPVIVLRDNFLTCKVHLDNSITNLRATYTTMSYSIVTPQYNSWVHTISITE